MRTKKNPEIRREAFIEAAARLFIEKGCEAVSVRDVLDAVGERTASPSVFYYYFPSKEALYQACVRTIAKSYLSRLREGFRCAGASTEASAEERLIVLASMMERSLREDRNLLSGQSPVPNRLFVLDMRERVTAAAAEIWAEYLEESRLCSGAEARVLAQFLSGGIGELIYRYMLDSDRSEQRTAAVIEAIVRFALAAVGFSEDEKRTLLRAWKTARCSERKRKEECDDRIDGADRYPRAF